LAFQLKNLTQSLHFRFSTKIESDGISMRAWKGQCGLNGLSSFAGMTETIYICAAVLLEGAHGSNVKC